jgi:hypothetical protein
VYQRFPLGGIWEGNLGFHLRKAIAELPTDKAAISFLNDKQFYDFTSGGIYRDLAIDWRLDFLKREDGFTLDDLPPGFGESGLILDEHVTERKGRRVSADFLNRYMWINRMRRHVTIETERPVLMEIGGGFGAFMRALRGFYPGAACIFVDIPETLFFLEIFLRCEYPDARIHFVMDRAEIHDAVAGNDFVIVPHYLASGLAGLKVDLLANTNSFGEMRAETIRHWFDLFQNRMEIDWFFSLNRFFNRIDMETDAWRLSHLAWSFFLDGDWRIHDWEVDPSFERCPYLYTAATRNLHLVARRRRPADPTDRAADTATANGWFRGVFFEDWNCKPYWDHYVRKFGKDYPAKMTRSDRDLTPDLARGGTLFRIWEMIRLDPTRDKLLLMLRYMEYLGGTETPFEEVPFLLGEINKIKDENGIPSFPQGVRLNMDSERPGFVWS